MRQKSPSVIPFRLKFQNDNFFGNFWPKRTRGCITNVLIIILIVLKFGDGKQESLFFFFFFFFVIFVKVELLHILLSCCFRTVWNEYQVIAYDLLLMNYDSVAACNHAVSFSAGVVWSRLRNNMNLCIMPWVSMKAAFLPSLDNEF